MSNHVTTAVVVTVLVVTAGVGLGVVPAPTTASDAANSPPTADAGADRTVDEGSTVTLDASGSTDPDGDVVTHNWTQTAGPPVTLTDRYATSPNVTAPTVATKTTLTFEVTASDGNGGRDTDTVTITVVPTNDPPTADAGPDRTVEAATSVTLDASASTDRNDDDLSYTWRQVAGAGVALVEGETADASFTAPSTDTSVQLVFEVTATDTDGASATDTVNVTVTPADVPTYTRDEIAQATYGYDFDVLSTESAREIDELYLRQPLPPETAPADLQTRAQLARAQHDQSFAGLNRSATIDVQSAYDAQFGETDVDVAYTRDDIAQAKYAHDFAELSAETAGEVEELYDRQPFAGLSPGEVQTRSELSRETYGVDHDDLSRDSQLTIERLYDAQFGVVTPETNVSVSALSASKTTTEEGTVRITARITNHGSATVTPSVELRLDRDGNGTVDDDAFETESLTLDPNETARVDFTVPTDAFDTDTRRYGVYTASDSQNASLDDSTATSTATSGTDYDWGAGDSEGDNATADTDAEGPVSDPDVRGGETVVELSELRANHRYEVDLGDAVAADDVTVTGQELMLVRSTEGASLRVTASEAAEDAPALSETFAYLRVEAEGLTDDDIMEVDFVFHIAPSTLEEQGVDPRDVRLYRYHDGKWESYETIYRGDGRFESGNVPGFSVFAIGPSDASAMTQTSAETSTPTDSSGAEDTAASQTSTESEPTGASQSTATETVTETATSQSTETATSQSMETATPQSSTSSQTPGFTPVTMLAALVCGTLLACRLRGRR